MHFIQLLPECRPSKEILIQLLTTWQTLTQPVLKKASVLIETNDNEFKHHLDRYKYSKRYDNEDPIVHREKCLVFIDALEEQLKISKFLHDEKVSALDISILPFIRQFRIADMNWFDSLNKPKIQSWLMNFLESELFKGIMFKYEKWEESDEKVFFPN